MRMFPGHQGTASSLWSRCRATAMAREEAAYWLGMAMHRKNPRRVLAALRLLLSAS